MKHNKTKIFRNCLISFFITIMMLMIIMMLLKMTPFNGQNSFASMDANTQYLDFFGYLINVLEGKDSLIYSFNSALGDTGIGIFSYYLASPINILILLFNQEGFLIFFDIIVGLKAAICSFTMAYYLQKRFNNKMHSVYIILLSISYALMQYNIAQSSNIMWLDGVYMLPLILLGVYKVVNEKKITFLSVSVALSIIFNWYSAGINCIFSCFWFLVESLIVVINNKEDIKIKFKRFLNSFLKYVIAMLIGVMISAILFIPTVLNLLDGPGGNLDFSKLYNEFNGNVFSVIYNYYAGAQSVDGELSIYCGSIPLIGAILYFVNKYNNKLEKICLAAVLITTIIFCFYKPFFLLFSLLKMAGSYYCRYSYIVIFTLIYIASNYYKDVYEFKDGIKNIISSLIFSAILFSTNYFKGTQNISTVYITAIFLIITSLMLYLIKKYKNKFKVFSVILLIVTCTELIYSGKVLEEKYLYKYGSGYSEYINAQEEQIKKIKEKDNSIYRISQTRTRYYSEKKKTTGQYNESLLYNYMSNVGYTSCLNKDIINFLDRLGYINNRDRLNVVNTSLIGADSLLGVRYILSDYEIAGLEKVSEINVANKKYVYQNDYAFPMAFKYIESSYEIKYNGNPFEYQNDIFSKLIGENVEVYKKQEYKKNLREKGKVIYNVTLNNKENPIYGYIPWDYRYDGRLKINNTYEMKYGDFLCSSLFYIPVQENTKNAKIELTSQKSVSIKGEYFYYLDLEELKNVTNKINKQGVDKLIIEKGGNIECEVVAKEGENLFISIANTNGFSVYRNGEKIESNKFEDCLISIPLIEGKNNIEIKYRLPGFIEGIIISLLGIVILVIYNQCIKKSRT